MAGEREMEVEVCSFFLFLPFFLSFYFFGGTLVLRELSINRAHVLFVIGY